MRTIATLTAVLVVPLAASSPAMPQEPPTWNEVGPIFAENCIACHGGAAAPAGLRLDTLEAALAGGANGPVLVTGDPDASELVRRIRGVSQPQMPLARDPLPADVIALIETWVAAGMPAGTPKPAAPAGEAGLASPAEPAVPGSFASVEPIFLRNCVSCHSEGGVMGEPPEGLLLDGYEGILGGGERVAVVPGNPAMSEIIRRVEGLAEPRMPFEQLPLDPGDIALLRAWIEAGAPDAAGRSGPIPVGGEVRLRGRLTGEAEIDGAVFLVDGGTRIDDRPALGEEAEMQGVVQADGSVRATRFRDR